jgi:tetratricopeptide (TPR) repeat protein
MEYSKRLRRNSDFELHRRPDFGWRSASALRKVAPHEPGLQPLRCAPRILPQPLRTLRSIFLALFLAALFHPISSAAQSQSSAKDLLTSGHADEAIDLLQKQIAHSPSDAESHNLLCRVYFSLEQWDRAISACERAVNLYPQNSRYHLWLGRAYGEKADKAGFFSAAGLAKKVRTEFERAVELNPSDSAARVDLAEFYTEAPGIVGGGKDKARAQADALMPLDSAMSHWVAGRIAEKNKDTETAEREYRAAIAISHGGAHSWLNLAIFFRHTNRLDEMEQAIHTMESRPLDRPESLMDGASLLFRTNRNPNYAIQLLRQYLTTPVEEEPAFKAHDLLGQLLQKQGDRQSAIAEYHAALSLAHGFSRTQENLKRLEH